MDLRSTSKHQSAPPLSAAPLRKVARTSQRGFLGAPRPNRTAISTLIVGALLLTALVVWVAFFRAVRVPVAAVESNLPEQVFGLGVVGSRIQSNVGFKVPGVLVALYADQGYRVKAGQVLAQLDARDVEAQLAVARAGVVQAQANIEKANADVASATVTFRNVGYVSERDHRLVKKGTVSVEQTQTDEANLRVAAANVQVAKSEIGVAQAALKSAQAQVAYEQATLDYYTLRAPYDAFIVSRNLELGTMPNPGQSVFTLVDGPRFGCKAMWTNGWPGISASVNPRK